MAEILEELIGKELAGVGFIRDYVEIYFDGPILRYYVFPVLHTSEEIINTEKINWRDSLCSLIGDVVSDIVCEEDIHVEVIFKSGKKLVVDMTENPPWGEMMHFVPYLNGPVSIW